jgi:hexulose-6-phosphate isomerase
MDRRTFFTTVASTSMAAAAAKKPGIRKGVLLGMLPKEMSYADRCKLAVDVGFQELECPTIEDDREAAEIKKAADAAKLPIHSVMNMAHWKFPLSSGDPEVIAQSMKGMETSLRNAHFWGADCVLLVPAVVNPETPYKDAWTRSQQQIRKLIPLAEKYKVVIGVEDVWNKFLLSPVEFAQYVDSFRSPWLRAYFDVGNIVFYGYPQDWIRTLGNRIVKLHFKDFRYRKGQTEWVNLRDGDINWPEVHKALNEIAFAGTATVELRGGDREYLADVSKRVDLILSGA